MAGTGKKISELIKDSDVTGEELIPVRDVDGITKSIRVSDILTLVSTTVTDTLKEKVANLETVQGEQSATIAEQVAINAAQQTAINTYGAAIAAQDAENEKQASYIAANASEISGIKTIDAAQQSAIEQNLSYITEQKALDAAQQAAIESSYGYIQRNAEDITYHLTYQRAIDDKQAADIQSLKDAIAIIDPEHSDYDIWDDYNE